LRLAAAPSRSTIWSKSWSIEAGLASTPTRRPFRRFVASSRSEPSSIRFWGGQEEKRGGSSERNCGIKPSPPPSVISSFASVLGEFPAENSCYRPPSLADRSQPRVPGLLGLAWGCMNKEGRRPIPAFIDLAAQRRKIGDGIERAISSVLKSGQFVLGPEVTELERRLAEFCGAKHVVSCANGTDALLPV